MTISDVLHIFDKLENLMKKGREATEDTVVKLHHESEDATSLAIDDNSANKLQWRLLRDIIEAIDELIIILKNDELLLINVTNQSLLRTCFQFITTVGFSQSLLSGVGVSQEHHKKCSISAYLPVMNLNDEQKYQLLVECTDFFTRSYNIPVLKDIIIDFYLTNYLAALIQLSFAPLRKPGYYNDYIMTQSRYEELSIERKKYVSVYENLVCNCFQRVIMKELLVLQSVTTHNFVKRVTAKEMSRRLLASEGLLNLIHCFIESYEVDTGFDWKKIDMIYKIVSVKHGNSSEYDYLTNICAQITKILSLNNTQFLMIAIGCVFSLHEKFPQSNIVSNLSNVIYENFNYEDLTSKLTLPGTVIMTSQDIEHKINLLHIGLCVMDLELSPHIWLPNMFILFILGMTCRKSQELKQKIKSLVIKCLEKTEKVDILSTIQLVLFGPSAPVKIAVLEFEGGLIIKSSSDDVKYPRDDALTFFLETLKISTNANLNKNVFEISLKMLINITDVRANKNNRDLLNMETNPVLDDIDEQYAIILQLLTEISSTPEVITTLKDDPHIILEFAEYFIMQNFAQQDDECVIIALVLLTTFLSNAKMMKESQKRFENLVPFLMKIEKDASSYCSILCKEALSMISSNDSNITKTTCSKALEDVFDELLPVRAHSMMELTKLIDSKDPEAIAKKHYIFCIFQDQLKDTDSYIYLSAINGIAALGSHCTEDVLHVLCKEFLNTSTEKQNLHTKEEQCRTAEVRMKIGDVIVKLIKRLGEIAVVHKTVFLNTMLCACRDDDPLIRTSALSNLAEISLVINYKLGTIIYEVLVCIWDILESDKAIECRRAAVMVLYNLLKGLGREILIELKENLLPIYRTLKHLYNDPMEDSILRLHAQIALEELNEIVTEFLFPKLTEFQIKHLK